MEGRRPIATLGTGRRRVALPTRYRSSAPGMLARVSDCFRSDQLPQRWALRTEPQGGNALPAAMPCTEGGYSCARLRAATAKLHLQNKRARMQGWDGAVGSPRGNSRAGSPAQQSTAAGCSQAVQPKRGPGAVLRADTSHGPGAELDGRGCSSTQRWPCLHHHPVQQRKKSQGFHCKS